MKSSSGFTLIEMAIVLVIIGLLLGGLLMPLSTQMEQKNIGESQKAIEEIKEALIGYAASQTPPHLPCPDKNGGGGAGTANDGLEDFTAATGVCVTQEGNIPWATLGVADRDAWGNRIRYRVDPVFSARLPAATFTLASSGTISVTCPLPTCNPATTSGNLPALILSHGRNGLGAVNSAGLINPAPTSVDELENTNTNASFVLRTPSPPGSVAGEFDDIASFLSPAIMFNRLVSAAKLP